MAKYDCTFTVGSTTKGFMLLRDKNGWPVYHRSLASYLGNSTPSGRVTIDSTNPEKLLIREQVSFSKGFGQVDFEDVAKYYDSTDCDATVPGRVYLGPASTAESAIAPTLTNGGFETAIGAEWTTDGARTSTFPNEGSYELTCDSGENAVKTISWSTAYRSKTIYVTAAAMPMVTGGTGTLTIADGVDTTVATATFTAGSGTATTGTAAVTGSPLALVPGANTVTLGGAGTFTVLLPVNVKATAASGTATLTGSPVSCHEGTTTLMVAGAGNVTVTVSNTWRGISAAHTLNASATQLTITVAAVNQQCLFDSVKIATPARFCQFLGSLYQARGTRLEKWSGSAWALASAGSIFTHEISDLKVYQNYLMIAFGNDSGDRAYIYSSNGTSYAYNTARTKVRLWGTLSDVLYGVTSTSDYSIYTINATTGAESSGIVFYESNYAITKIIEHPDTLYIVKSDSLWKVTSGAAVLMLDLKVDYHANTGKNSYAWHNDLFIPTNSGTLYRLIDESTVTNITPSNYGAISTYRYRIAAMAGDGEYLTVIMTDGTDAYILRGHYATVNGDAGWYWHPVRKVTGLTAINDCIIFSDSGVSKLFIAAQPGACWLYHPTDYSSHAGYGSGYEVTSGYITTSNHYSNFKSESKAFYSVTVKAGGLNLQVDEDRHIIVGYNVDNGTYSGTLGTLSDLTDNNSPQTFYFPSGTKGKSFYLTFALGYGLASTAGPYLEWYSWEGQLLPTTRPSAFQVGLNLAPSITNRDGITEAQDPAQLITFINSIITNGAPVAFVDPYGVTYYVSADLGDDHLGPAKVTEQHEHRVILNLQQAKWTSP